MKRYFCTVAVGMLLALAGAATASAGDLPVTGQTGTQLTSFGDQTVGEQKNDADVTQEQGNDNLAITPALGLGGDAETTNKQGNGNEAEADVEQSNNVDQSQDSTQTQSLDSSDTNGCCDGQSQTGEQKTYGGDQTVEKQENDADVTQEQGNGNIAIAPAIAVFGDAETTNYQGNDNEAEAEVEQSNDVDQSQESTQKQEISGDGGSCCDGQSQTGEQKTSFGDQTVGEQKNDADVTQEQGNGNVAISPAIALFGDAETTNYQGNGNEAKAEVEQKNDGDQSQDSYQRQELSSSGSGGHCCDGSSQTGEQKTYFGDQTVEKQKNDADVTQEQGNGNVWIGPAIAIGGDAETTNKQGNGNTAKAEVEQENGVDQSQSSTQKQEISGDGSSCCESKGYGKYGHGKQDCCHGSSQTGEQKASFGDQTVGEQKNYADVTQEQGNDNFAFAPAVAFGHGKKGDAETANYQGNGNEAKAEVEQSNDVDQSQSSTQKQYLEGGCSSGCKPAKDYSKDWKQNGCCEQGSDQSGSQKAYFGDQTVEKQKNDADVTQEQGNDNVAFSPALAFGHGKQNDSCNSTCGKSSHGSYGGHGKKGDAETANYQGNGNEAKAEVEQSNDVDQSQTSYQRQSLVEACKELVS
jgi:hypothetical protein